MAKILPIAETKGEAKIQPNAMTDDLGGETLATVEGDGNVHLSSMPQK